MHARRRAYARKDTLCAAKIIVRAARALLRVYALFAHDARSYAPIRRYALWRSHLFSASLMPAATRRMRCATIVYAKMLMSRAKSERSACRLTISSNESLRRASGGIRYITCMRAFCQYAHMRLPTLIVDTRACSAVRGAACRRLSRDTARYYAAAMCFASGVAGTRESDRLTLRHTPLLALLR